MLIVIEGIGGVGKTTLSRKLLEEINFTYVRESRYCPENLSDEQIDDYFLKKHLEVISGLDLNKGNFLLDRSYFSSFAVIYSKVMSGDAPQSRLNDAIKYVEDCKIPPFDLLLNC